MNRADKRAKEIDLDLLTSKVYKLFLADLKLDQSRKAFQSKLNLTKSSRR
jgi:hypothetical protein